ncbi:4Fe-4S binding protein [Candidatus Methanomassiliicoccus intestinalis]|uniref:4Fe-4S binding protein n=1 Tax=Candidatus Methanomassiliicoccus intestinalis TaxID=1406512 RepID=UPI0037DC2152
MASFKMAKTVLKSLFKKPVTKMYPVVPREWEERTRGHVSIIKENCILCGICARKCPTDAISVDRKGKTWTIERMSCIQCSSCVEACPKDCLVMEQTYTSPDVHKISDTFEIPLPEKEKASENATS